MSYPKNIINKKLLREKVKLLFCTISVLLCFVFFPKKVSASHIVGGELTYQCIGGNSFEVKLTVYRDCFFGGTDAPFDSLVSVGVFNANNDLVTSVGNGFVPGEIRMFYTGDDTLSVITSDTCFSISNPICLHSATYVDTILLPAIPGGYQLAYQRCCRNSIISNIQNPASTGATFYTYISENSLQNCNSGPQFGVLPPSFVCINEPINVDQSVSDLEGDSIVYSICTPLNGASFNNPQPQPPFPPPYNEIQWNSPNYSYSNPLGGVPLTINPETGIMTGTPNTVGLFVVGICIEEYENGELISGTRRDLQISVGICNNVNASFEIPDLLCDQYQVEFQNTSTNASNYFWSFGENGFTSMDENPTYTYTNPGVYEVMLVAEPQSNCPDTTFQNVEIISGEGIADFSYFGIDCGDSIALYLTDISDIPSGNILSWVWTLNDGQTSNEQHPMFMVSAAQNEIVNLEINTSNGCISKVQRLVPLTFDLGNFMPLAFTICEGDEVQLNPIPPNNTDLSYSWFPPTGLSSFTDPSPIASPSTTTIYNLILTNGNSNCVQEYNVTVQVLDAIDVNINVQSTFCGGESELEAVTSVTPANYIWSDDLSFNNVLSTNQSLTVSDFGQNTYYVQVSSSGTCVGIDSITIIEESVNVLLENSKIMCLGTEEIISVTNLDPNDILTYTWTPDANIVSGANTSAILIEPTIAGQYVYYVEISNQFGCTYVDSVLVSVLDSNEIPEIEYSQSCNSSQVQITHTGDNFPFYFWELDLGNGIIDTLIGPTVNYNFPSNGNYNLRLNPVPGLPCNLPTESFTIEVNDGDVTADFDWSYISCYNDLILQFEDVSTSNSGNINSWLWEFSNGDISILQNPIVTLNSSQDLEVDLIITTDQGCIDTLNEIIITSFSELNGFENMIFLCESEPVELNPNGSNLFQYSWAPSNLLNNPNIASPIANPLVTTEFQVTITDTDNNNCEFEESVLVTISEQEVNVDFDFEYINCSPDSFTIIFTDATTISSGTITDWNWTFSNNQNGIGENILLVVQNQDTIGVELEVITNEGCVHSYYETIELTPLDFDLQDEIIKCAGLPVNLNPGGDPTLNYQWSPSTNLVNGDTIANPIANPIVTTTYCVTVTDGNCVAEDCITVIVPSDPLIPTFTYNISDCVNEAIIAFQDETISSLSPIISWDWNFVGLGTSTAQNPTLTLSQSTTVEVELTVTTADGCVETSSEIIEVNLVESNIVDQIVLCDGGGAFLNPGGNPNQTYLWSPPSGLSDPTSPNPFAEPGSTMIYVVEVSNGACLVVETVEVVVPTVPLDADFSFTIDDCTDVANLEFQDESVYSSGNISEWNWQFSNGDSSSVANPQLTINQSQVLTASLIVTTDDGCIDSTSQIISIDLIDINVQDSIISCSGGTVELNPGGDPSYSYLWSPSSGLIGSPTSPNPSANPATSTTYTVTVTAGACQITRTVDIIVPTNTFQPNFEYNFDDCTDVAIIEFTDLTNSSNITITNWDWVFVGNTISTSNLQNPVLTLNQSDTILAELTITTVDGCIETISEIIEVNLIDINIETSMIFCSSETLVLNPNGNTNYNYLWSPAGLLSNPTSPSPTVTGLTQTTNFSVTVTNGNCSLTRNTEIVIPSIPIQAGYDLTYQSCLDSATVTFNDLSIYSGSITGWNWQINSDTSTLQNPTFVFNQSQAVDVQLIITSDENCRDTLTGSIDIELMDLDLENAVSSCNGEGAFLNPNGNPNLEYLWSPNISIGNDTTAINPFATPSSSLDYTVVITDPNTGCVEEEIVVFNVPTIPLDAAFDWSISSCSDSTTIEFNDSSVYSGIIDTWQWNLSNGVQDTLQSPTIVFPNADTIDVQLIVTSIDNCIDSITLEVPIDVMSVGIIEDTIINCEVTPVALNPNGNPNLIYNWAPAATLDIPNSHNPIATSSTSQEYTVTITNPNNTNCIDIRSVNVLTTNQPIDLNWNLPQDTLVCDTIIEIVTQPNNASTYCWSTDPNFNTIISNDKDLLINPSGITTYYFQAKNDIGCFESESITVSPDMISVEFPTDKIICIGDTTDLEVIDLLGGSALDYSWIPNNAIVSGANTSTLEVSPTESTEFELTIESASGCEYNNSVNVQVIDLAQLIEIEVDRDSIVAGESVQLSVPDIPGLDYYWEPCTPVLNDCQIHNPIATLQESTIFTVFVDDLANACFYTDSIRVGVERLSFCEEPYIFVPKGFTPNGDGLNDVLYVRGNAIVEMTFSIYNRWGEKIFETTNIDKGWDGKIDGKELTPDVFGYFLSVKCAKGEEFVKKGNVTLIR